ncbi:MAG: radical SAM protein, partial [Anaerolineales bacterium]|nr:radical SAM protein [Anaerolineales bacterium]
DTLGKLELLSSQMGLEPAEEASGLQPPAGAPRAVREAGPGYAAGPEPGRTGRAPCGHSPAELHQAMQTLTQGAPDPAPALERKKHSLGVSYAAMPGGRKIALLKTLLTSACERDCFYCPFRARRNFRRATFKPEEMAGVFSQMHKAGLAEGLFLSSGIAAGGVRTQDRLIDAAEVLRRQHVFRGYLHLKLMPGLERDQLLRAMQLADRVSINLEAPNTDRLRRLAPHKVFLEELLQPLKWAHEIRQTQSAHTALFGRWPSLVTQFVVGGAGEDDLEILSTSAYLIQKLRLARVYFSAFHPVPETPLENQPPEDPWREHRLYQASFLLRDYGFQLEDLPFTGERRLPLDRDPKQAWAEVNLSEAPVEVNRAERRELLRVPGLGPKGVEAILQARRNGRLKDLRDLRALGVLADRAAPFILLDGRAPARQLRLF